MSIQKTTLNLPEELHAEAKAEAARLRISLTQLVIQALETELRRVRAERRKLQDQAAQTDKE